MTFEDEKVVKLESNVKKTRETSTLIIFHTH